MNFRLSERHTEKMKGYLVNEYKPCSIPQFSEATELQPATLSGFIHARKIVGTHSINEVFFDDTGKVVILKFKDGSENVLSDLEYHKLWKKKCIEINKEYDKYHPNRGRVMNIVADKLDIKAQRSE